MVRAANGHVLGYSLEVISDCRLFLPTPPGLLNVSARCLSRLALFDIDGTVLLDQPHLMRNAEGEIYGNDSSWSSGEGDDEWSIHMKCLPEDSPRGRFVAATPGVALELHYY